MTIHEINGGGGLKIAVREFGNPDGKPILLVHGFMQSSLCCSHQYGSDLASEFRLLCMDIRGHGMSQRATSVEDYGDSKLWADDVAATIESLNLTQPIIAGASYGGFIINDYVSHYGDSKLGGINYVAAAVYLGNDKANAHIGTTFVEVVPGLLSPDLEENIAATRRFVRSFYAIQPSQEECETVLAYNMVVPTDVRAGLVSRNIDGDAAMGSIKCPVLVTQGDADVIVLKSTADCIKQQIPQATVSVYEGIGHTTYSEAAARFNNELGDFTRSSTGT